MWWWRQAWGKYIDTRVGRAAVSKHLRVLREARLVRARERGREWDYSLDARPLAEVYREWLESFAPYWEESLGRLKQRVEEKGLTPVERVVVRVA